MYEWDEAAVSCGVIREDFTERRYSSRELKEEKATQASTERVPQVEKWQVQA